MKYYHTIILLIILLLLVACPEPPQEEEKLRFEPLNEPIEGTLLFIAGPTLIYLDSLKSSDPWDFHMLNGTDFTKLSEAPWFIYDGFPWNYQWSPKGNYFSFFHDKDQEPLNTDDIAIIDINNGDLKYLTESLGDANTFDGALYQWAEDDSYIYFSAIPLGESEYDPNISPDIYRVKSDGSEIEQITENEYYEAHATPTNNHEKLFYKIFPDSNYPDSLWGYYTYDFDIGTHEQIVNKDQWESFTGVGLSYPLGHMDVLIEMHPDGENIIINNDIMINVLTGELSTFEIEGNGFSYGLEFLPNNNDYAILYQTWLEGNIYKLNLNDGSIQNLTSHLKTIDGQNVIFSRPAISPSGDFIAFTAQLDYDYSDWNGFGENLVNQKTEIYLMNLESKEITRLTKGLFGWEGFLKWIN